MQAILIAFVVAFGMAVLGTPVWIRVLKRLGITQPIHDAVTQHAAKAGSPTMGGAILPVSLVVAYAVAHWISGSPWTRSGVLLIGSVVGAAAVGAADDWLKVRRARNLGLRERQKTVMLTAVGLGFAFAYTGSPDSCTALSFTRCSLALGPELSPVLWVAVALGLMWVTSNSVNFTDGLEGLLSGSASGTFAALAIIGYWQFRHPSDYGIANALDLSLIGVALAAACLGFMWWNCQPKAIFMGDTGSLAIGVAIAHLVLMQNLVLLLPLMGALYVIQGASSFLQRWWFRVTRWRSGEATGKRLFRMAPFHHHLELGGWPESTVLVRLWIVSAASSAAALGIFYADALRLLP